MFSLGNISPLIHSLLCENFSFHFTGVKLLVNEMNSSLSLLYSTEKVKILRVNCILQISCMVAHHLSGKEHKNSVKTPRLLTCGTWCFLFVISVNNKPGVLFIV